VNKKVTGERKEKNAWDCRVAGAMTEGMGKRSKKQQNNLKRARGESANHQTARLKVDWFESVAEIKQKQNKGKSLTASWQRQSKGNGQEAGGKRATKSSER
jgi:hypothetical protein